MMHSLRLAALFSFACLMCCETSLADWRPCGPGNTWRGNRLIRQGFFGADFRPGCACHDACLAAGNSRAECDRQFLGNMNAACANSSNPERCYRKARSYYRATRLAHLLTP